MYYISKRVENSDCDPSGKIRISAAIRYMHQCCSEHMVEIGIGDSLLQQENMVFLLNKTCVKIFQAPTAGQQVRLGTAANNSRGTRFYREFVMETPEGERLMSALTVWILVDPTTRKIYRASQFPFDMQYEERITEGEIDEMVFPKVEVEQEKGELVRQVGYSLLDNNGHVNNSFYADFVCDFLPYETLLEKGFDKIVLGYKNEAKHADEIRIHRYQLNEKEYYMVGTHGESPCFEAIAILK